LRAVATAPGSAHGDRSSRAGASPNSSESNAALVEIDLPASVIQDRVVEIMDRWLARGADGWRLDAMYSAGADAWAPILQRVRAAHSEAWILGEVIHGDYPAFAEAAGADSLTQYELWKAIWSSLSDHNLFELAHALGRHQGFLDAAGGAHPLTFVGNHDKTRIASQLPDGRDLAAPDALLALLPGIHTISARDVSDATALKEERAGGDDAIRPWFPGSPDEVVAAAASADRTPGGPHHLTLLKPEAAERILEVHRRLLSLRRREAWLATASVRVDEGTLENTWAQIVLTPRAEADGGGADGPGATEDAPAPLTLVLNLGDEPRPAPGEVLAAVSGADMLDGVAPAAPGQVPAHGIAVVR